MRVKLELDHIVIAAETLDEGVEFVESSLGVRMANGGKHKVMGTHNRLLSMGPVYLEVIAIDPDASSPNHFRWFNLDNFQGAPRVTNWVARCSDLAQALKVAPKGAMVPVNLSRGDLSWSMGVSDSGMLPYDNTFPALIQWHGNAHPAARLPDVQCRLEALEIGGPYANDLRNSLSQFDGELERYVVAGNAPRFAVSISTPSGVKRLK